MSVIKPGAFISLPAAADIFGICGHTRRRAAGIPDGTAHHPRPRE